MAAFLSPATFSSSRARQLPPLSAKPTRYHVSNSRAKLNQRNWVVCSARTSGNRSIPDIELMACDMDGTMLGSLRDGTVRASEKNVEAVKKLIEETNVTFIPATGKSRGGTVRSLAELGEYLLEIYPNGCPGVFLQGLVVFGLDGEVVYENRCVPELARVAVDLADELNLSLIAFCRDRIVCTKRDAFTDSLPAYHESQPELIESWDPFVEAGSLNKFIFMADPARIIEVREHVAKRVGTMGVLTQAQSDMLEVLPPSTSKGNGVRRLIEKLGISPKNVLAIGDAENDLELLKMVGCSCAVANALPAVKEVAMYTDLPSNDDSGVAAAIERFILQPAKLLV